MSQDEISAKVRAQRLDRAADRLNEMAANIAADCSSAADHIGDDREKWLAEARREWPDLTAAVREVQDLLYPTTDTSTEDQDTRA